MMKKILAHTGIAVLVLAAAVLAYGLLRAANSSLTFVPMTVFPFFAAVVIVAVRVRFPYSLLVFLLAPVSMFLVGGMPADPTDTRFYLLLVVTFDLLFLLLAVNTMKRWIRNEMLLGAAAYLVGKLLTYGVLLFGIVPVLPLLSYRTATQNYLWGSLGYCAASLACYLVAVVFTLRFVWKGNQKDA